MQSKYLIIGLKNQDYAIPIRYIREVTAPIKYTPIPKSGPEVLGLINLRGEILTLYDLARKVSSGSGDEPGERTDSSSNVEAYLILTFGNTLIGAHVDRVESVEEIFDTEVHPAPPSVSETGKRNISGIRPGKDNPQEIIYILDLESVFEEEIMGIKAKSA